MKEKRHRNIQRHARHGFRGWSVRFMRRRELELRFFADRKWGGRSAALETALRYPDDRLLALYPPLQTRLTSSRSNTGIVGVFLENHSVEGRSCQRYCASWPLGGGRYTRRYFAVKAHGKRRALALAAKARRDGIGELERRVRREVAREVLARATRRG